MPDGWFGYQIIFHVTQGIFLLKAADAARFSIEPVIPPE
jgi:hypothetical protein